MNLIEVLRRTSAGLHSVASMASTNLSTPMRARAEELDQAIILTEELIDAADEYLAGHNTSERLCKALHNVRNI